MLQFLALCLSGAFSVSIINMEKKETTQIKESVRKNRLKVRYTYTYVGSVDNESMR